LNRGGVHDNDRNSKECYCMDSPPKEERDEVTEVSISYASANPRAVVIMNFNTDSTLSAVE
jgi:hypothetical protein